MSFTARRYPKKPDELGEHIEFPNLLDTIRLFLHRQTNPGDSRGHIPLHECPDFYGHVHVFHSAVATFRAPCDKSGINEMARERIRAVPNWRGEGPRHDTVFIHNPSAPSNAQGIHRFHVGRVRLFFSIQHDDIQYSCALIEWFNIFGNSPDEDTGMWVVQPRHNPDGSRSTSVVNVRSIVRNSHLMPIFGEDFLPYNFHFSHTLDAFASFFVNKYVDYHSNFIAF